MTKIVVALCAIISMGFVPYNGFAESKDSVLEEPGYAGEGAIAFYPFADADAGTSAVGVPIANSVSTGDWSGSVVLNADSSINPFATFVADRPGTFIYESEGGKLICRKARALRVGSGSTDGKGGVLSFAGLGAEISKHHTNGHTVEYFFRVDGTKVNSSAPPVVVEGGYLRASAQQLRLYAPLNSANITKAICSLGYYGDNIGDNPCRTDMTFSPAPNDGQWHHVALVETNLTIQIYYDYELRGSFSFNGTGLLDSGTVEFFRNYMQGWVSCLRVTDHALGKNGFLRASSTDETGAIAFYPFADADAGTSAVGVPIINSVSPGDWSGSVVLNADSSINPFATFVADGPGAFVYAGEGGKLICSKAGALRVGSTKSDGSGGTLSFLGLGAEISKHHTNGHTVEYFFRVDGTKVKSSTPPVIVEGGYLRASAQQLRLYAPLNSENITKAICSLGYFGDNIGDNPCRADMTFSPAPNDGQWHHVALVETNLTIQIYYDYELRGSFSFNGTGLLDSGTVEFFRNYMQGWVSCLRVTDRALGSKEFLRAFARAIDPIEGNDIAAFYTFKDGASGTSAESVSIINDADPLKFAGNVNLSTTVGANATAMFDDDVPGMAIYGGEEYPVTPFATDVKSIACTSDVKGSSATIVIPSIGDRLQEAHRTGFTVEYFFKFTDDNIAEYDPCFRMNVGYGGGAFNVAFPVRKTGNVLQYGYGDVAAEGKRKAVTLPSSPIDGKWHHFALVETPVIVDASVSPVVTNWQVSVWMDYRNVDTGTGCYTITNLTTPTGNGIELCRAKHHCKYSCLKVTTRPLGRREFMRTKPRPQSGVLLIVR